MNITPQALRIMLWALVGGLCVFGLVMIASTTLIGTAAGRTDGTLVWRQLTVQAAAMALGLGAAAFVSWFGAHRLRSGWWVAAVVGAAVLALLAVLAIGRSINGARRWIDLGPVNLQPAELAKLAVVIGMAWWFSRSAERARSVETGVVMPLIGFACIAGLVYLTKDLGSVVVMGAVLVAVMLQAGAPWLYFCGLGLAALPVLFYFTVFQVAYRRDRMLAFLDPWTQEGPAAYHLRQSFIAIGSGGVLGVGLGQGGAKLAFLPERHTDFIFAVVCEELGMVGACGLAFAFLMLVAVGLMIAQQSRDLHRRLLATGAVIVLGTQAFWNMLVVIGAVPTKGLTLPFISYGGSSVVICLVLVGIIDAVARANALDPLPQTTTRLTGGRLRSRKALEPTA